MADLFYDKPIEFLKGVGPHKAELLRADLGISTYGDLIRHYPFRYVDRSKFYKISEATAELPYIQLKGQLVHFKEEGTGKAKRLIATFKDESGKMDLLWFQGIRWIKNFLSIGTNYVVFGRPSVFKGAINMVHPEVEELTEENSRLTTSLQAVYNTTEKLNSRGLNSRGIARLVKAVLINLPAVIDETLSPEISDSLKLMNGRESLIQIHNPTDVESLKRATLRLKFEELFYIQLRILRMKLLRNEKYRGHPFPLVGMYFNNFYKSHLPFPLTDAQKRVIKEIRVDMGSNKQMNRLLQGDVGSGKTLVALMTMFIALDNGFQASLMAPTELLATQHYQTIKRLCDGLEIKIDFLTGSTKKVERAKIHASLLSGETQILIGTHALLEHTVQFKNLGLVVIDEQHRFGVEQRSKLWQKNEQPPHVLVMTATPIPRTLAMTVYGDLDISIIDELPPGRTPVQTFHNTESSRPRILAFIKEQIKKGRQIYIVYPLIEESETLDYKNLMDGFSQIQSEFPPPTYKIGMVHGRMKALEKEEEMTRFKNRETQILVATTVIEVGVDVPNATVMVIESAERFGLSQLHQLRGRVGRGAEQSFCILITGHKLSFDSKLRMETMVRTGDGFEIADVDLQLRGHGDIEGTQQSGQMNLKLANLAKDGQIVQLARDVAGKILNEDPHLDDMKNKILKEYLIQLSKRSGGWSRIS